VSIKRAQVELVLAGRFDEAAGIQPPRVAPDDIARIAADLTHRAGCAFFADPDRLAMMCGLRVRAATPPAELDFCCSGRFIVIRDVDDPTERRLLVLQGISHYVLAHLVGAHKLSDVVFLAAELAAPSDLIMRRGIAQAIRCGHAPAWFLRAWARSISAPPSSQSFAT
jgi:hypothetical protein